MLKVTIFGYNHPFDMIFLDEYTKNNLKITWRKCVFHYAENTIEWNDVWNQCENEDLVLIASFGMTTQAWLEKIKYYENIFSKIKNLAYWTFDSHWDTQEVTMRKYFNHWLTAHTECEKNTGPNTLYLPVCYWQHDYKSLVGEITKRTYHSPDIVFHHNKSGTGDRDILVKNIELYIKEANLSYDFSVLNYDPCDTTDSRFKYYRSLAGCKVGLNMSLVNDINLRCFEVWMSNKPLLTNYLDAFNGFINLRDQTIFYKRDLSDFKEKLQEALVRKVDTRRLIIKDHMLTQRYLEGINLIMNTHFKINFPNFAENNEI